MEDPLNTQSLHRLAIEAALNCDWKQAITLNEQIIKIEPKNIPSLNRLAKALTETGKYPQAKKIYHEVLNLDPYNPIAQKNLKRLGSFKSNGKKGDIQPKSIQKLSAASFLQEPGLTKIVNLIKVTEPQKLSLLYAGITVKLVTKSRGISVSDLDNGYIGVLPDDTAHQLLRLMKGGNKYSALIKAVKLNGVTILIREIFRSRRFKNQPSFLDETNFVSFSSDHLNIPGEESEKERDLADNDELG